MTADVPGVAPCDSSFQPTDSSQQVPAIASLTNSKKELLLSDDRWLLQNLPARNPVWHT
jgi:hypothetical protein